MSKKLAIAMFGQKRLSREGGVEIVVKELCTRMAQNGCDVTCYNRAGHHVSGAEYDDAGKTEYEGIRQKSVPTIERRGLAAVSSSAFAALYSAFGKYDVVHIHAEGPAFFAWLPKMFGKRVVVTVHGIDWQREKWQSGLGSKFIHQGEKNAAKYADEVIVLSKGVQDYFKETYGREGFVGIHPNWSGISVESIRSLCLSTYLPEEVMKLNDIAEMRAGATLGKALQSEYMTVSGACFINQSSPVMTISKNGIRFSKACHSRLDDCEYVELLYHPILQVVILRKSNHGFSTTMRWRDDNDVHSAFSARAFSGLVFQTLNWRRNCRYQCRGICRGQKNAKFLIFELDESRILTGKNQYEQENCSMNLKCRLYRSKWVQSITVSDVMESGQVVENPMIGAIPSRNEVQRELDDLLMSM